MNKLIAKFSGLFVVIAFISLIMISQTLFKGLRLDLTENSLYSVSEGTENILAKLDEPINLYFFFSKTASQGQPALRSYALRVQELLEEYVLLADGKLRLTVVDPEPFSEDEDRATEYGLAAISQNPSGDGIYFGLVGTNSVDDQELIPYFHPEKEALLEHDLSKLIYRLNQSKKPKIGLIDGLSINGGFDPATRQPKQPWFVMQQISQLFEIDTLSTDIEFIPEEIDALWVTQPKGLTENTLYAIDQFVLRGGKLMIFSDPSAFVDQQPPSPQNPMPQSIPGQDFNQLFNAWGFKLDMSQVVLDNQLAMQLNMRGRPVKHLGVLSLAERQISNDELITSGLESINLHSAGRIELIESEDDSESQLTLVPLLRSTNDSMLIDKSRLNFLPDPSVLQKEFTASGESHVMAARISGLFKSAFSKSPSEKNAEQHLAQATEAAQVIVVADVDLLADMMWVQVQQVFGQPFAQMFADNGDFIYNLVDTMSGSSDLIGLRGRGRYSRPFEVVQNLRVQAELKFLDKEQQLQNQLQQTEQQLSQLQASVNEQGQLILSPEQQQAIDNFQRQKLSIRKELRNVRHQLDKDIAGLGNQLALINTLGVPLLLGMLAIVVMFSRRRMQNLNGG